MMRFSEAFSDSNIAKVYDFMVDCPLIDIDVSYICYNIDLSRKTVDNCINKLLKCNLIYITRRIGKTNMYDIVKKEKYIIW